MIDNLLNYDKISIADRIRYGNQINKQYGEFFKEEPALWRVLSALVGSPFLFRRLEMRKKQCSKCKEVKSVTEFYQNRTGKGNLSSSCIECCKESRKAWYKKMRKEFNGLYSAWLSMKWRCIYPKHQAFKYYGGRGIIVCEEWKNSFSAFYKWAKGKHKKGLEIDRINNDGNYCPENCRFITHTENLRKSSATKLNAEKVRRIRELLKEGKMSQRKIGELFGVDNNTISCIHTGKKWRDIK